jgi:2-keto-4-pentenoate hydratase/2-oxohepta-3-ene-1,7-dioic acid hydratase in catechol pathway
LFQQGKWAMMVPPRTATDASAMKFFRIDVDGAIRVGVLDPAGDEGFLLPEPLTDLVDIAQGAPDTLALARRTLESRTGERLRLEDRRLLSPIGRFRRDVLCTGWNYWDHFEEGRGKRLDAVEKRPDAPTFFTKSPDVVIGPTDPIAFDPRVSQKWDYEAELVVIIGKAGRSIPATRAMDYVLGFSLANDVSARDLQGRHGGQWLKGKSIDGTMPLGPYVVTPDEIDLARVRLECFVNGDKRQDASVAQMAFAVPELLAELSFGMSIKPGDVLLTGTPAGVGFARKPPLYLQAGDEIVVRGSGLGELRNRVTEVNLYGDSSVSLPASTNA